MEIEILGQLKGPECSKVMSQTITLRKALEPAFAKLHAASVNKISLILRIDGSLGSFGAENIENISCLKKELSCDIVIKDHSWNDLSDGEIATLLKGRLLEAINMCFDSVNIKPNLDDIQKILGNTV